MPRPETNSSTIANVFLNKKYEGDKARFQLFEAEVKMALLSEVGEYGVTKLRDQGYWFIQPPTSISADHAGYFFDSGGKLSLICNQNLLTDVSKMDTYEQFIILPDISNIIEKTSSIYSIYGADKMNVQETVDFLTESYILKARDLTFLTISIDNFPATSSQITKYYKTPICMIKGNLQARNKSKRNFDSPEELDKHTTSSKATNPYKDLERRNINIGTTVGTDVFGPISNKCASYIR